LQSLASDKHALISSRACNRLEMQMRAPVAQLVLPVKRLQPVYDSSTQCNTRDHTVMLRLNRENQSRRGLCWRWPQEGTTPLFPPRIGWINSIHEKPGNAFLLQKVRGVQEQNVPNKVVPFFIVRGRPTSYVRGAQRKLYYLLSIIYSSVYSILQIFLLATTSATAKV
jgi:hypothetical protein